MIRRCHDVSSVREALSASPRPLALVPTMGALHEGHLALLRAAREKVGPRGTVAISIFVNPIQFDRPEDLSNYPQTLDSDLAACEAEGVPAGSINDMAEVMADPQVIARGMQIELDGVPGIRSPFSFSDAELALHRPSPKLGEDNPTE